MFDKKVKDFLHLYPTPGRFGVEIEMEMSRYIDEEDIGEVWRIEDDGSLRGVSCELVLKAPANKIRTKNHLKRLEISLKAKNIKINPTIRAGVHIHTNFQEHTIGEVFKFLVVYYTLEVPLIRSAGDWREGNLFCLRARDAVGTVQALTNAVKKESMIGLSTDELRYTAMNFQSLFHYGSLEFRALGTPKNVSSICPWLDILDNIRKYAVNLDTVWDIPSKCSGLGPRQWAEQVLGAKVVDSLYYPEMEDDMIDDLRNIQFLLHAMKKKGL